MQKYFTGEGKFNRNTYENIGGIGVIKNMQFGNRFGEELLSMIQLKMDFNAELVREVLSSSSKEVNNFVDWFGFRGCLMAAKNYQNPKFEDCVGARNIDPIVCFTVIAEEHPSQKVSEQFWQRALELDAFQAHCVRSVLYGIDSIELIKEFRKELEAIAKQLSAEEFISDLSEWSDDFWTESLVGELARKTIGILGLRNRKSDGELHPKSKKWRRHWLTGWLLRRLISEDQIRGENKRLLRLNAYNPVYARVFQYIVSRNKRYFRQASVDEDDKLQANLILYRFGEDPRAADWCVHLLYKELSEGRFKGLTQHDQHVIMSRKLWEREFRLLAPIEHPCAIAFIRRGLINEYRDLAQNQKEKDEGHTSLEDFHQTDQESIETPEESYEQQQLERQVMDWVAEISSIRQRVAFVLEIDIMPRRDWCKELILVLPEKRGHSIDWSVDLSAQIIDVPDLSQKEELLSQLFGVDAASVRRYARRGRDKFEEIKETKLAERGGKPS